MNALDAIRLADQRAESMSRPMCIVAHVDWFEVLTESQVIKRGLAEKVVEVCRSSEISCR